LDKAIALGLTAYEFSFGLGVRMTDKTATLYGELAKNNNIVVSVHAPYYINLANNETIEKSLQYIKRSCDVLAQLGGTHLVVHTGTQMKLSREEALTNARNNLQKVLKIVPANIKLCLETMGKYSQIGNVDEIVSLCDGKRIIPTLDFGHINCLEQGKMDIEKVFAQCAKFDELHIHISFIEFGEKGEKKHLTFGSKNWSFDTNKIWAEIIKRKINATIICESAGTMAEDAKTMQNAFAKIN
jgi:deoxyribonuclease-4